MDKFKNITAQEAKDLLTKDNYLIDISCLLYTSDAADE